MAGFVMRYVFIAALVWCGAVAAQGLPDPTRPPSGIAAAAGSMGSGEAAVNAQQLQSVIMRQGAKSRALINGEWFEVGQTVGESKIVKITMDRVEIKGPEGRETLRLTPDVETQASGAGRGTAKTKGTTK